MKSSPSNALLQQALVAIEKLEAKLDAAEYDRTEPIAIVGIGCRFPGGASSPALFWQLLEEGRDAIQPLDGRWRLLEQTPWKDVPGWAGLLDEVTKFDASFFGIAPREADSLDPQQRLLLEVAWEALENAGLVPSSLSSSRTGVFVGACSTDYLRIVESQPDESKDAYSATGNLLSVLAGRLSYMLGLEGPCLTVDTACSSSLVAVHLACSSLRSRECDLAITGGVNLILSAHMMSMSSRLQAFSSDGRCHTFDAGANGFVRGEGCGVVVLKRLSDARRDEDRIWALIRGSAINQDGRSTGLTTPNVLAQEALLRDALLAARLSPEAIGYVETHGTGTALGDPIEVEALRTVLGAPRAALSRCVLGALKTNIGHLEAAAGIAGLIKAVLALHHEKIPKNLNFRRLNPRIRLEGTALSLANEATPWPRSSAPRYAGVSSFGLSGTNAHVVLAEAPFFESAAIAPVRAAELCVLSAKSRAALLSAASRLAAHIDARAELSLGDLAFSLATTRATLSHRLALVVPSPQALRSALALVAKGLPTPAAVVGEARSARGKLAWLFSGQGAQTSGMGRALYDAWPVFRHALEAACAALDPHLRRPLREIMWAAAGTEAALLDQTEFTQPALFALGWALAALWRSWGVQPHLVAGHSSGELTAACVAGVFSLPDAARLVAARGRLMQALPAGGAMVSIAASEAAVAEALSSYADGVTIAAINSPDSVVISGNEADVLALAAAFAARGAWTKRLAVSHAFHSPHMEPMLADFLKVAESIRYQLPALPLLSNVSGKLAEGEVATPRYWVSHARAAVRFADGVRSLQAAGATTFLELGPKATLLGLVSACLPQTDGMLASLRSGRPELEAVLEALGGWYVRGGVIDWKGVFPSRGQRVELPTYPFQRRRFWLEAPPHRAQGAESLGLERAEHPLLGSATSLPDGSYVFTGRLSLAEHPWLGEHVLFEQALLPATAFMELALAVGQRLGTADLESLTFERPLVLPAHGALRLQITVGAAQDAGRRAFAVHSRGVDAEPDAPWTRHASGMLHPSVPASSVPPRLPDWPPQGAEAEDLSGLYEQLHRRGYHYGPGFRGLREVYQQGGVFYGHAELPQELACTGYRIHPALLDAALHTLAAAAKLEREVLLPFTWKGIKAHTLQATRLRVQAQLCKNSAGEWEASLTLYSSEGEWVGEIERIRMRPTTQERLLESVGGGREHLYRVQWQESSLSLGLSVAGSWAVVGAGAQGQGQLLLQQLADVGARAVPYKTVHQMADAVAAGHAIPSHVLRVLSGTAQEDPLGAAQQTTQDVLSELQTLTRDSAFASSRFALITQGAVAVTPGEAVQGFWQAGLWGLLRSVRSEHPDRAWMLVDTDDSEESRAALLQTIAERPNEVALRRGARWMPQLVRASSADAGTLAGPQPLNRQGTVLVSGGTRGVGALAARHLARHHGIKHLLLVSRQGPNAAGAAELVAELSALGCMATAAACDVADQAALSLVLGQIDLHHPLVAVFHCAEGVDDEVSFTMTPERLERVFFAKARGAWNLHLATKGMPLSAFVCFSSAAGLLGSAGQADGSAASTFVEALCAYRQAMGLPGQALAWGSWEQVGPAEDLSQASQKWGREQGIIPLRPREGMELLDEALVRSESLLVPIHLELHQLRKQAQAGAMSPLLRELAAGRTQRTADSFEGTASGLLERLRGLAAEERKAALLKLVQQEATAVLRLPEPAALPLEQPLQEAGLDSLMAVELRGRLGALLSQSLPATLAYDHPTPSAMADFLSRCIGQALGGEVSQATGQQLTPFDAWQCVRLPAHIAPLGGQLNKPESGTIFITGASGCLGRHILASLLQRSSARLICLVRGKSEEAAQSRLRDALDEIGVDDVHALRRVEIALGDITQPQLGLGDEKYERLANDVTAVVHAAAKLDWQSDYPVMAPVNVEGTIRALEFAARGRAKRFHHISSLAVYPCGISDTSLRFEEQGTCRYPRPVFDHGYGWSKWVSEGIVGLARQRGLAASCYRPGLLVSTSRRDGTWPLLPHYLYSLFATCLTLRAVPESLSTLLYQRVESVADLVARVILLPQAPSLDITLIAPQSLNSDDFVAAFAACGISMKKVSDKLWIENTLTLATQHNHAAAGYTVVWSKVSLEQWVALSRITASSLEARALRSLLGQDACVLGVDRQYLTRILQAWLAEGHLARYLIPIQLS